MSVHRFPGAEHPAPDLSASPVVDRWTMVEMGNGPLLVGYDHGGGVLWLEIAGINETDGWARLRAGGYVRLGRAAPPVPVDPEAQRRADVLGSSNIDFGADLKR